MDKEGTLRLSNSILLKHEEGFMKKCIYKVSGFVEDMEYKIVANDAEEAAEIFHKLVGTNYSIKEIVYLFEVYL